MASMWVSYAHLNSILQRRYNFKLKEYPEVKVLLKSYDINENQNKTSMKSEPCHEIDSIEIDIEAVDKSPRKLQRSVSPAKSDQERNEIDSIVDEMEMLTENDFNAVPDIVIKR